MYAGGWWEQLRRTTAYLTLPALLAAFFILSAPSIAYASCGFGSAIGGGNPTVTSNSAESFTPTTANLFASITNLGSAGSCRGYLTTADTSPWTVPSDWTTTNTIEIVGGGGSGGAGSSGGAGGSGSGGGGGGGYATIANQSLSSTVSYSIGIGGNAGAGGDSWFCNSSSNCSSVSGTAVIVGVHGGLPVLYLLRTQVARAVLL